MSASSGLIPSGIPGLDDLLGGGLRPNHMYFVEGMPGTGKTTLGLQFALGAVASGETALVVSLAESVDEIRIVAESHGWDLDGIELRDLAAPGAVRSTALFELSEMELDDRVQALLDEMDRLQPQRLVLDTLAALRAFSIQAGQFRRHIEELRSKAQQIGATMLITDQPDGDDELHPRSLAWGVIRLEQQVGAYGPPRRWLWLPKLRGQHYQGGRHDLRLALGGLKVFPRLDCSKPPAAFEAGTVGSGLDKLDALLGGGVERGTSIGLIGPPGCGKSTLAATFALAAVARGERAVIYTFDESLHVMRLRAASQGMDFDGAINADLLLLRQLEPATMSPGELARELATQVTERGARVVVIDSLNGYVQAMPNESTMAVPVQCLLSWLAKHGVLTLVTLTRSRPWAGKDDHALDLSYIVDTVIAQRYFEAEGSIRYAISVLKKRYGDHERTVREYRLGNTGIEVGEPLSEFRGVLSGAPEYVGRSQPLL